MYSNSPFKKYFFAVLCLWIIFLGVYVYFLSLKGNDISKMWIILTIGSSSFILNIITILNSKFRKKRRIWALVIYGLLFISSIQEFFNINVGVAYLLLSLSLLLMLDIFPISSSFKYFNIGMLTAISGLLYFPTIIIILLFLFMTIVYYKEKINISQYLAGVLVTIILIMQITYLTDNLIYVNNWIDQLTIPKFHFEYQIPILLILLVILVYGLVILVYGWINQYSNNNISEDLEISSQHTILIFYLLFWILIYAFFMGDNYELLVFISLPVSLIVSRCI